ncbi:MAG: glycosyltransferase [Oscillospiraceae bacterium]|nr:glycosyltransferase [Oscillospiraceae bacterium]
MKLSIIVPVYNVERYLEACVDSLLAQTIGDFEIFLVDDGSKDSSGEIAERYAAEYPETVRCMHLENGGQGRARNQALPLAKGDFVGFVDSDDWIDPEMYQKLYDRAQETGADVVYCDFLEHYTDGREAILPAAFQEHPLSLAGSSCNKIFRRSLIGDLRFPEGLWYEDFYFSAVMLVRSQHTEYVPEPLYVYRRGQESTMHNNNAAKNLDILTIMDMLEEELIPLGRRGDFEFFLINHVILDSVSRLAVQESAEKKAVIAALRSYAHEKIPRLTRCESFRAESLKRRIIMFLNYHGMEELAQRILRAKAKIK